LARCARVAHAQNNGTSELEAKRAEAINRSLRALTVLSTLLLPPTVVVGAFGMNLRGIPFAEQGSGFWSATLVCVLAVAVAYWALKRTRIL
jgi:zinc transporter